MIEDQLLNYDVFTYDWQLNSSIGGPFMLINMRLEIFETRSLLDGRFRRVKNGPSQKKRPG